MGLKALLALKASYEPRAAGSFRGAGLSRDSAETEIRKVLSGYVSWIVRARVHDQMPFRFLK